MIWASALRLFFSRNLLDRAGEKILLMIPGNDGGLPCLPQRADARSGGGVNEAEIHLRTPSSCSNKLSHLSAHRPAGG
jgi:hypothetical protein